MNIDALIDRVLYIGDNYTGSVQAWRAEMRALFQSIADDHARELRNYEATAARQNNANSLRTELAARAMQGFLSSNEWADEIETAIKSVKYADALIAELNKGE